VYYVCFCSLLPHLVFCRYLFGWFRTSRRVFCSLGNEPTFLGFIYDYVYTYIYIHIYMYIYIYICIYTYIYTYVYIYIYIYISVCIHIYLSISVYIYMCVYICIYTYIRRIFDINRIHFEAQTCSKQFICHCRTNCPKKYFIAEIEFSLKSYLSFSCFVPRCSPHTIYMYIFIYICTYLYVYISVHIYTCIYICVCVYMYIYK